MAVGSSPERRHALLPLWLFLVAWTATSLVPTAVLLAWRLIDRGFGVSSALASGLSSEDASGVAESLETLLSAIGVLGFVLSQACLLHQFRDRTRGWAIAYLITVVLYLAVAAVVIVTTGLLTGEFPDVDRRRSWLLVCGGLLFAAVTWSVIRAWGWRHLAWLTFSVATSFSLPLFSYMREWAQNRTGRALATYAPQSEALVAILPDVVGDIVEYLPLGLATAWVLWHYVAVHRPSGGVDAPPRGA